MSRVNHKKLELIAGCFSLLALCQLRKKCLRRTVEYQFACIEQCTSDEPLRMTLTFKAMHVQVSCHVVSPLTFLCWSMLQPLRVSTRTAPA